MGREDALVSLLIYRVPTDIHWNLTCPPQSRKLNSFTLVLVYKSDYFVGLCPTGKKKKNLKNHFWMACINLEFLFHLPKLRTVTNTYWETNMD